MLHELCGFHCKNILNNNTKKYLYIQLIQINLYAFNQQKDFTSQILEDSKSYIANSVTFNMNLMYKTF